MSRTLPDSLQTCKLTEHAWDAAYDTTVTSQFSGDPYRRNFVVGEKSQHGPPNAYIYQYPSLTLEQTLKHGTEQAYSAAAFNQAGDRLATVGSYPDFMLTVWDWRSGCTLLRSKAFSQEVYCVSFCPYADGSLVTSGLISVVFWMPWRDTLRA